jgi:hypothetical protein
MPCRRSGDVTWPVCPRPARHGSCCAVPTTCSVAEDITHTHRRRFRSAGRPQHRTHILSMSPHTILSLVHILIVAPFSLALDGSCALCRGMTRLTEYRAQLAVIKAEQPFHGQRKLIAFFKRLIAEETRSTSEPGTSNFTRLLASSNRQRRTVRSGVSTKNTRRKTRSGSR